MVETIEPKVEVGRWGKVGSANTDTTIYTVTAKRNLKLRSLVITNPISGSFARVMIFDSASSEVSGRRYDAIVGDNDTAIINREDLYGVQDFYSAVVAASDVSGIWVGVGGDER